MVLEATNKLRKVGRYGIMIYVPSALARDSQFPFQEGQKVKLRIDSESGRLIVEAADPPAHDSSDT